MRLTVHVSPTMLPGLSLSALLHSVSASSPALARCRTVTVVLRKEGTGVLAPIVRELAEGVQAGNRVIPITDRAPGRAFPILKPTALGGRHVSQIAPETGVFNDENGRPVCCVPLLLDERPVGILALNPPDESYFDREDIEFLSQMANNVASEIENILVSERKQISAPDEVEIESELNFEGIVGRSAALRRVSVQVETVAATDSTVLLYGETGTGKELIARAIHDLSSRRSHTFVKFNCAAIPTGLLESELFGHEKGAFTGAVSQRIGRFELADQGTIFLDEIGEFPLELQPKLLRILQEREFERLGSSQTLRSDGRLIAATNRDLARMVDDFEFRTDLFYRLNVFPIRLPPLRERPEDIPLLVRHFMQYFARRMNRSIDVVLPETMRALVGYHWPGNIRELQNLIGRAVILSRGPALNVPIRELRGRTTIPYEGTQHLTFEEVERAHILATLNYTKWVLSGPKGAAARLGVKRTTLQYRMEKLGIVRPGKGACEVIGPISTLQRG
jgi:formate hydrogenlyase transcriptional activator